MVEFSISEVLKWYEKSAYMTSCCILPFLCFSPTMVGSIPLFKKIIYKVYLQSSTTAFVSMTYYLDAGSTQIFFGRIEGYC